MKNLQIVCAIVLFCGSLFTGCAGRSSIDLIYEPAGVSIPSCPKRVAVVMFKDQRPKVAIGEKKNGKPFYSRDIVAEWISRALYEELRSNGCSVEYHDKAYAFDTDYVLTGIVQEAFVKQKSYKDYAASMRLKVELAKDDRVVFEKSYLSTLSKATVPSPGVNSKMLTELLQGMMREVVPEVRSHIE